MKATILKLALLAHQTQAGSSKPWRVAHHEKANAKVASEATRFKNFHQAQKKVKDEEDPTTIVQWWTTPSYITHPWMRKLPDKCGGCWLTNDRSIEKEANSILIDNTRYVQHSHKGDDSGPDMMNRNPDQYWVFWPREAASKGVESGTKAMEGEWDKAFNLTTSYRRDSDIPRVYGNANSALQDARYKYSSNTWREVKTFKDHIEELMSLKNPKDGNYAAWMVSNCDATRGASMRFAYVQRLIELGLRLGGYGECFDNVLVDSPWTNGPEFGYFSKYKFYFAFENSVHCNDYMSEKFWRNSLSQGLVPVVAGTHPDDVEAMAPPNSYIHVEDYATPEELYKYLDYLNTNDTAYLEYHQWRKGTPDTEQTNAAHNGEVMECGICQNIQMRKKLGYPKRIIKSVASWWWKNVHDGECTTGSQIPQWLADTPIVTMGNSYDELKTITLKNDEKSSPKKRKRRTSRR